jgi:hypothetical protein
MPDAATAVPGTASRRSTPFPIIPAVTHAKRLFHKSRYNPQL